METIRYLGCRYFIFFWSLLLILGVPNAFAKQTDARTWLINQTTFYVDRLVDNMSPSDGLKGAIIAAKSRSNPDYYFHWVRDAALTIDSLIQIYPLLEESHKRIAKQKILEYIE